MQYTGGISSSTPGVFGTLGVFSRVGDTMSTVGDAQYTGDIMSTVGDIMSTLGDIMINVGECHWENN